MKLGLLGSHVAIVPIEGTHGGLGAAMEGSLRVGDRDAGLLGRGQLLNEAVSGTGARL